MFCTYLPKNGLFLLIILASQTFYPNWPIFLYPSYPWHFPTLIGTEGSLCQAQFSAGKPLANGDVEEWMIWSILLAIASSNKYWLAVTVILTFLKKILPISLNFEIISSFLLWNRIFLAIFCLCIKDKSYIWSRSEMPGSPWFQKNVKEVPLDRFTKCSSVFPGECRRSSEEKNERPKICHLCFFDGSRQVETGWVRSNPLLYISTWTDYELMLLENSGMCTGWMSDNPDHALKCVRWWPIGG